MIVKVELDKGPCYINVNQVIAFEYNKELDRTDIYLVHNYSIELPGDVTKELEASFKNALLTNTIDLMNGVLK